MSVTSPSRALNRAERGAAVRPSTSWGLYVVLLAQLMLVLDAAVMNVGLPHIQADLGFSTGGLSWVLNAYALTFGGLLLLGGRLGDVFGRRRVFWLGLAIFTLFSLIGGLAPNPETLVIARALQGAGAAIAAPSVLALLTTSAPTEAARNRALSQFTAVSAGGAGLGLLLGGLLTDVASWRWTLFINVPIGLLVLATVRRGVSETPRRPGRFDFVGAVSATGAAAMVVWTVIKAEDFGWGSWQTIGGFAVAAALIVLLGVTEARHPHPLLRLGLLKDRSRVAALFTMAGAYGSMMAMFFLLVLFFEGTLEFGPMTAGFAFLPMPLTIFTLSRVVPRLVARYGTHRLIVIGAVGRVLSFALLLGLHNADGYWTVFGPLWLMAISSGLSFMPLTAVSLQGVEPEHAGAASGLLQTMQQLGGAIGFAVIASVYATFGKAGDFMAGGHPGFVTALIIGLLSLAAALTLVVRRPAVVLEAA
ncbi:MAG: MFS transporter [Nocardioides sp.]|uniref:MFS transporter n=1 Tax=Nocardioides sp. TaxID=35761 RepID=UPI0039E4E01A